MKSEYNKEYPTQVWLLTITLPALYFGVLLFLNDTMDFSEAISIFFIGAFTAFFAGFLLSLPLYLLITFSYVRITGSSFSNIQIRLITLAMSAIGMLLLFRLLGVWIGFSINDDLFFIIPYSISLLLSIFLFPIKKKVRSKSDAVSDPLSQGPTMTDPLQQ